MSHVAWSVCLSVCWSHTDVLFKTAEPIEMPFGGLTRVGPRNHALDEESRSDESICRSKG